MHFRRLLLIAICLVTGACNGSSSTQSTNKNGASAVQPPVTTPKQEPPANKNVSIQPVPTNPEKPLNKAEAARILSSMKALEQQGTAMESLRKDNNRMAQCGDLMRPRMEQVRQLRSQVDNLTSRDDVRVKSRLAIAGGHLINCVTCSRMALEDCNLAKSALREAEREIAKLK